MYPWFLGEVTGEFRPRTVFIQLQCRFQLGARFQMHAQINLCGRTHAMRQQTWDAFTQAIGFLHQFGDHGQCLAMLGAQIMPDPNTVTNWHKKFGPIRLFDQFGSPGIHSGSRCTAVTVFGEQDLRQLELKVELIIDPVR